jgi:cytochrome P450
MTRLRDDFDLIPSAVEEMLRFESPLQRTTFRLTTQPIVIGSTLIEQGQQVSAVIGAANRDRTQFPRPEIFDIARRPNRHLAFGLGIHSCIGPALTRMEARVAFQVLLEAFPRLRLGASPPAWNTVSSAVRGLRSLPVVF